MDFDDILKSYQEQYPPTLNTRQVAEMLGSTAEVVRTRVKDGDIPAYRWGKNFRYFRDEVLDWLRQQQFEPKARERSVSGEDFTSVAENSPGVDAARGEVWPAPGSTDES